MRTPERLSASLSPNRGRCSHLRRRPDSLTLALAHWTKSNLSLPLWDLVPFLCGGGLTLTFTVPLVLLVKDDSNDSKVLGKQHSQHQLPTAARRDGPCVRALGTLFLYIKVLSHLFACLVCLQVLGPRSSCSTIANYPCLRVHLVHTDVCALQRLRSSLLATPASSTLTAAFGPSSAVPMWSQLVMLFRSN